MTATKQLKPSGQERRVALAALKFDPENPRLPLDLQGGDQEELAVHLELGFDAYTVAESIASHGFFGSEPLIVVVDPEDADTYLVVEGNRRLAALKGLADSSLRSKFATPGSWDELAERMDDPLDLTYEVPVVEVASREAAAPIIGFRHISGILQWTPYAQARYVARLVDEGGQSFADIAKTIGVDKTRVGNLYRDQAIAKQAKALGVDTSALEGDFSLVTVAMGNVKLREHIGADLGSRMAPGKDPIPDDRVDELKELLGWIYGSSSEDDPRDPIIKESRDIGRLGRVVASEAGLKSIRDGESIEMAEQKVKDANDSPRERLINRLRAGRNSLKSAMDDISDFTDDDEVRELIDEARDHIDALLEATSEE